MKIKSTVMHCINLPLLCDSQLFDLTTLACFWGDCAAILHHGYDHFWSEMFFVSLFITTHIQINITIIQETRSKMHYSRIILHIIVTASFLNNDVICI